MVDYNKIHFTVWAALTLYPPRLKRVFPPGSDRVDVRGIAEVRLFMSLWRVIKQLADISSVKDWCR